MPTKEQMETASKHIADVISRNYIKTDDDRVYHGFQPEGGGRVGMELFENAPVGTPEPFSDVPFGPKLDLLLFCVDWKGFSHSQETDVVYRVIDGKSPDLWMDGIEVTKAVDPMKEQFKAIVGGESGPIPKTPDVDLIADFHSRIDKLKREGVPDYPPLGDRLAWAEASEERKLENIVWESMEVWLDNRNVIRVPGMVRLETIERNVDYANLPESKRGALESLRVEVGQEKDPDRHASASLVKIAELEDDASGHEYEEDSAPKSLKEQFKQILAGVNVQKYGKQLSESIERAMARMQGKDGRDI
jgi:hypothetical protein